MKLTDLASPGIIPNSQKLRIEALKAINYFQIVAMNTPGGKVDHATTLDAFFDACKIAIAGIIPEPVMGNG